MAACWSRVSLKDREGVTHSVDVLAESLYEAVALAVHQLTCGPLPIERPDATVKATVELLPDTSVNRITHEVELNSVYVYARSQSAKSPAIMAKRDRIRKLLEL